MPVLTRSALSASPLADLHLLAGELGLDGYRRLRKAELIDRILERQGSDEEAAGPGAAEEAEAPARPRRSRRRRRDADDDAGAQGSTEEAGGGDRSAPGSEQAPAHEQSVEGAVALQSGGSGLITPAGGGQEVYVSAAQVRRCELVDGDVVGGPVRPPRRSERRPSLIRVETINGAPADEVSVGTPYDQLPCELPTAPLRLSAPALAAITQRAPIGRGSRVTISGPALSGKTELLRWIASELAATDGLELMIALAGNRPEETAAWNIAGSEPQVAVPLPAAPEARARAVEGAVDAARRMAVRGQDVVLVIDSLDGLDRGIARRALGAARNLTGSGSLTVIAAASQPVGGETTLIALDRTLAAQGQFPALDPVASGTLRADLLAGQPA